MNMPAALFAVPNSCSVKGEDRQCLPTPISTDQALYKGMILE